MPSQYAFTARPTGWATGLTATGTTQGTAAPLPLRNGLVEVSTVASNTGVVLPVITVPCVILLRNAGANSLKVYPQPGGTIDKGSANAAITVSSGNSAILWASSGANWYSTTLAAGVSFGGLSADVVAGSDGVATIAGFTHVINATVGANQNDWSPTGFDSGSAIIANRVRITASNSGPPEYDITGLLATHAVAGQVVILENVGTWPLRLVANSSSSAAANRFLWGPTVHLGPKQAVELIYDATLTGWTCPGIEALSDANIFGSAALGNVTITGAATNLSASAWYDTLTLQAPNAPGWKNAGNIIGCNVLDLSGASAAALVAPGNTGSNGSTGTGGAAGTTTAGNMLGGTVAGTAGANGGSTANGSNATLTGTTTNAQATNAAATSGNGGGSGAGQNGGTGGAPSSGFTYMPPQGWQEYRNHTSSSANAGGAGGTGGGGGGSDSATGGGGGGGGAGGGVIAIFARTIHRGSNSTAAIIQARGGNGGAGAAGTGTNSGGGGGGSGGAGGWVIIFYKWLTGSQIAGAVDVAGGTGGAGGNKTGTGVVGNGANQGNGGRFTLVNVLTGDITESVGSVGGVASGQTGGSGGATMQFAL